MGHPNAMLSGRINCINFSTFLLSVKALNRGLRTCQFLLGLADAVEFYTSTGQRLDSIGFSVSANGPAKQCCAKAVEILQQYRGSLLNLERGRYAKLDVLIH
jgi:hypothetical protein